jgi:hypothetical protein
MLEQSPELGKKYGAFTSNCRFDATFFDCYTPDRVFGAQIAIISIFQPRKTSSFYVFAI